MSEGRMIREGHRNPPKHACNPPEPLTRSWGDQEYIDGQRLPRVLESHYYPESGAIWECACGKQWKLRPGLRWYRKWWRVKA